MTKVQEILLAATSLTDAERAELIALLRHQDGAGDDDEAVGRRGLEIWTASAREEDWSAYYPDELRGCAK